MQIINIPLSDLIPYENNPRNNDEAVMAVAASIKEFGFKVPVIVDKNNVVVAGHTRIKASIRLGIEEIPCIIADDLTDEQIKAFRIADNKTAEIATWNEELLFQELQELTDLNFDMEQFGFDAFNLDDIMQEVEEDYFEPEIDETQEPTAKLGDIYILGKHRLMCGNARSPDDIRALMSGQFADLCVTDPPYNVSYEGTAGKIKNDNMSDDDFYNFLLESYTQMLNALKPGGAFYIWHADLHSFTFRQALQDAGGVIRQNLIWNKNRFVLGHQDYQWKHEPCLYGWKDGAAHYFIDDRRQSTVLEDKIDINKMTKQELKDFLKEILDDGISTTVINEPRPIKSPLHPTMKPVKLMGRLIKNSSRPNETVIDLFGGSGSTLIACEQLERKCYMMELDPLFVDVIITRWEQFTGRTAEKISAD